MASLTGVPYQDLRWQDIPGQPFGNGVGYNGVILGSVENIIDMEGAAAVEGNVSSYRGMSIGFGRMGQQTIPYDPYVIRFLAGGNVNIAGALTVVGNVVTSGNEFQVGSGSTYLIGKSDAENQQEELAALYAADGSPYWAPTDSGSHYIISGYDVSRRIPAARLSADVPAFFRDARASLLCSQQAMAALSANGSVVPQDDGFLLTGTDPQQNVFDLAWPQDGSLTGALTFDTPQGSLNIVRITSGDTLTVANGLWGSEEAAQRTLYVLLDANTVEMTVPAAIHGSVLAPQTRWNSRTTGGSINGNAALAGITVQEGSGFELHWFPFVGGVTGLTSCEPVSLPPQEEITASDCICCCTTGIVAGYVLPNGQCQWRLKLQLLSTRQVLSVWQGNGMGAFSFEVAPEEDYLLLMETCCHYEIRLTQMGVRSLSMRG